MDDDSSEVSAEELRRLQLLDPVDLADLLEDQSPPERARILEEFEPPFAARVVEAIEAPLRATVVEHLSDAGFAALAAHLSDTVLNDLLQQLASDRRALLVGRLTPEARSDIEQLQPYSPKTAGGIMTTDFVKVPDTFSAEQVVKAIQGAVKSETLEHIYVVNEREELTGVCSLRGLLQQSPTAGVRAFLEPAAVRVPAGMDQEEVARVVRDRNVRAVPVVDARGRLVGVVTVDQVIDVIHQEASEDMYKMAGAEISDPVYEPVLRRFSRRVRWLAVTVVLELLNAFVMTQFEATLDQIIVLACFIPIVMAVGGGVGIQSSTIVIRGLATGQVTLRRGMRVILAESATGLLIGLVCGLVTALAARIKVGADDGILFGTAIFLSMSVSIVLAAVWGTLVPLVLHRFKIDPAVASGPLITATNDVISVLLFLGIATVIIL